MNKIVIISLILLLSCAHKQKKENTIIENKEIGQMEKYDKELVYLVKIKSHLSYDVKVNDISVATRFNPDGGTIWFPINSVILSEGQQSLEVNIYPRTLNCSSTEENINLEHGFEIIVEETISGNNEANEIFNYQLSDYDKYSQKEIDFSKLEKYTKEFNFIANVPYKIDGWKESQKFSTRDTVNLKEKVISYYNNLKYLYENQKGEEYTQLIKKGLYNGCKVSYFSTEQIQDQLDSKVLFINKKPRRMEKLENFKVVLFGNEKLIGLKRIDGCNNSEGVLRRHYKKNGFRMLKIEDILLHIPKGSTDLEVIWYMNYKRGIIQ